MNQPNLYEFLGVSRDASAEDITKAFREKALLLHPDKNKTDPDAAKKFKFLTQAYQTLTDAKRRSKYDESLPPEMPEQQFITDLSELWLLAGKLFFDQSERFTPAVDAMRMSRPITLEGDKLLIVGIDPAKANLAGYLNPAITHNHVRRIISELSGKQLDFRIISGTNIGEWNTIKEAEEKIRLKRMGGARAAASLATQSSDSSSSLTPSSNPDEVWDELMETLMRQWTSMESRAYAQVRARYTLEQMPNVSRAEDISRAVGLPDEQLQRNIARVLDRIASLTNIDSAIIALEYMRYRARQFGGF